MKDDRLHIRTSAFDNSFYEVWYERWCIKRTKCLSEALIVAVQFTRANIRMSEEVWKFSRQLEEKDNEDTLFHTLKPLDNQEV